MPKSGADYRAKTPCLHSCHGRQAVQASPEGRHSGTCEHMSATRFILTLLLESGRYCDWDGVLGNVREAKSPRLIAINRAQRLCGRISELRGDRDGHLTYPTVMDSTQPQVVRLATRHLLSKLSNQPIAKSMTALSHGPSRPILSTLFIFDT